MKRMLSLVMTIMLSVGMLWFSPTAFVHARESVKLADPLVQDNGIVAWDCVYFGTYPQTSDGAGGFLVEPIKWRVLKVDGNQAYLMSDKLIDCMPFCETEARNSCLYEWSTIRCWLNGYDASENREDLDYTENNFIDKAFTEEEQEAIKVTHVINDESMEWAQYYDKNHYDTDDKIFLISRRETTTAEFKSYGFVTDADEEDEEGFISEPTSRRAAYTTDYAAAGGSHGPKYAEYISAGGTRNSWNLRSPGEYPMYNGFISAQGEYSDIDVDSNLLNSPNHGTRPCLYLDLTKTDVYSYAGKAYAKDEDRITGNANYVKKLSDPEFNLNLKQVGDGKITYTSSNPGVAVVDDKGNVTLKAMGTVEITAVSAETDRYLPASKTVSITVKKGIAVITAEDVETNYGEDAFALGADAPTAITYESDNPEVCTVDVTGLVTIVAPGTAHILMTSEGNDSYSASEAMVTVTVLPAKQKITVSKTSVNKTYGDDAWALGAKAKTTLTYKSSDTKVATVSSKGKVSIKGAGKATITITAKAEGYYAKATKKVSITVKPGKVSLSSLKASKAKQAVVTWKKRAEATGYEVKYATSSSFKNVKTARITKAATVKKTLKSLKSGKKLYVKVRAYKMVSGKKLYGEYSKVKSVKVK